MSGLSHSHSPLGGHTSLGSTHTHISSPASHNRVPLGTSGGESHSQNHCYNTTRPLVMTTFAHHQILVYKIVGCRCLDVHAYVHVHVNVHVHVHMLSLTNNKRWASLIEMFLVKATTSNKNSKR